MSPFTLIVLLSGLLLIYLVVGGLFVRWRLQCRRDIPPVHDKLMRTAGERLRLRLECLDERTDWLLLAGSFVPLALLLAGLAITSRPVGLDHPVLVVGLTFGAFIIAIGATAWGILFILTARRTARRALLGERIVAENLNPLIADGHHVFHDVPTENRDTAFNVHHVVVGPAGIFAIETKTLQKRRPIPGRKEHEIIFDGEQIVYPWGQDVHGLGPARIKAEWLADWIYQITGRRIAVTPVLTFPGWWVNTTSARGVYVHNPKQLAALMRHTQGPELDPRHIELIADQLALRCRDVEL
ncbi:MAG TPA: nuclease-related domain-containing protein [Rariglobus sp.]|jgi:hypothetical protein|nr:nuclease-related domain-containing protein [Rariglobus sp.]